MISIIEQVDKRAKALHGDSPSQVQVRDVIFTMIAETIMAKNKTSVPKIYEQRIKELCSLLPKKLTIPEIVEALSKRHERIKAAATMAVGVAIAIQFCKSEQLEVFGKDVQAAVLIIRNGPDDCDY